MRPNNGQRMRKVVTHSTTLAAHRMSTSLLQRALASRPDLTTRHDLLKSEQNYQTLAVDAASYAIEKGDLGATVEFVEQGRALLWSQLRGLSSIQGASDYTGALSGNSR